MRVTFAGRIFNADRMEIEVRNRLIALGFENVRTMDRRNAPYDLDVNGRAVEVKMASPSRCGRKWGFSTVNDHLVTTYIFCLLGVPGKTDPLFLVLPAPLKRRYFQTTIQALDSEHKPFIENWSALRREVGSCIIPPSARIIRNPRQTGATNMARTPRDLIIERADFRVFLAARMGAMGLTVAGLAQELGVTQSAAYALLNGDLAPSDKILKKCGLEVVYRAVPPEKPKR